MIYPIRPGTVGRSDAVRVYLPVTLADDILPARWPEYAKWFVHYLYLRRHLDRRYMDGSYSPVCSKTLETIFPKRDRKNILAAITNTRVIETNGTYTVGRGGRPGRSTGYRLEAIHREAPFRQQVLHHPELAVKLARRRAEQEKTFLPVHRHLKDMLAGLEVVGDYPTVYLPLATLANGDHHFVVCEQGRVHTSITSLDKEYRKHIRWRGQELWHIDVMNSQPLILALTLRHQGKSNRQTHAQTHTQPHPHKHPTQTPPPAPYVPTLSDARLNMDAQRFLADCLDGVIYERLAEHAGLTRDEVKQRFFAMAYGRRDDMGTRVGLAFQAMFPGCFRAITHLKPLPGPRWDEDGRKVKDPAQGDLARRMQRLESDLVIGTACERLRKERPDACLLTIHDCLVTTEEHKDYFATVLEDAFDEKYGVRPKLHKEPFGGG